MFIVRLGLITFHCKIHFSAKNLGYSLRNLKGQKVHLLLNLPRGTISSISVALYISWTNLKNSLFYHFVSFDKICLLISELINLTMSNSSFRWSPVVMAHQWKHWFGAKADCLQLGLMPKLLNGISPVCVLRYSCNSYTIIAFCISLAY